MRQGHSQERLFSNPPKIIAWICFQSSVRRFEWYLAQTCRLGFSGGEQSAPTG
jgi:hypothetical protein